MSVSPDRASAAPPSSALALTREASEASLTFTLCAAVIGAAWALFSVTGWSALGLLVVALSALALQEHWDVLCPKPLPDQPLLAGLLPPQLVALAPLCGLYAVTSGWEMSWLVALSTCVLWLSLSVLVATLAFYTSSGRAFFGGVLAVGVFMFSLVVLALYAFATLIITCLAALRTFTGDASEPKSLVWLGDNAVDVVDVLGHHRFTHKTGVLYIDDGDGVVVEVPYGARLTRERSGALTISGGLLPPGQPLA